MGFRGIAAAVRAGVRRGGCGVRRCPAAALEAEDRRIVEKRGGTIRFSLAAMLMTARRRSGESAA
jgi:hypothetical protein